MTNRETTARLIGALMVGAGLSACGPSAQTTPAASAPSSSSMTRMERVARFPADLGPDRLDVADYPPPQRANYALFADRCSRCHTLARPINSRISDRETWGRYVHRMRNRPTCNLTDADVRAIADFLAFHSAERVRRWPGFDKHLAALDARFREVKALQLQAVADESRRLGRTGDSGTQPAPRPTR
ncbi:MAG: hypothetical protein AAB368_04840 [bacterium]